MSTVSPELLPVVRAQLKEGERLAWGMSPEPAAFVPKARRKGAWDAVAILGGGYAAIGSSVMAFRSGQGLWMLLPLSLVLLGVSVYLTTERLKARDRRRLEGTVYALTTRRALIVQTYPRVSVQALPIAEITDVTLADARQQFADLTLTTNAASTGLVFRGIFAPESARSQLLAVIRDPGLAEQQIAASERYMMAMRQIAGPAR
jgi:hypothetical protein